MRASVLMVSWSLLWGGAVLAPDAVAAPPTALEVATAIGFTDADRQKALNGQVVSADLSETTEKMLAQAVGMVVPAKIDKVANRMVPELAFERQAGVLAVGRIDPKAPAAGLAGAVFGAKDAAEATKLGNSGPGSDFNLSTAEFKAVNAAASGGPAAVEKAYQQILAARLAAYVKSGVAGIAPYDRGGGKSSSAGADLAAMTKAETVLARFAPAIYAVIANYPAPLPAGSSEAFFWLKRNVQDRPTFTLVHRIVARGPAGFAIIEREFYVGHSYNAAETTNAALPANVGTVVYSLARSTSDQVAGFMSGTRQAVGRRMLRGEMVGTFQKLQAQLGS